MSIYHLHASVISRSSGKSAVASIAYRSGERITDERLGSTFDYRRKSGVLDKGIESPTNSPSWVSDRSKLWNAAEKIETRSNSRTAREVRVALPAELPLGMNKNILKSFIKKHFVEKGMIADWAIHSPSTIGDDRNLHAHIMLTTRKIGKDGFTEKDRSWDSVDLLRDWRKGWADAVNSHMKQHGMLESMIDHRTLAAQGIGREPTKHRGISGQRIDREIQKLDREIQKMEPKKEVKRDNQVNQQKERIDLAQLERELVERYYPGDRDPFSEKVKKQETEKERDDGLNQRGNQKGRKVEDLGGKGQDRGR